MCFGKQKKKKNHIFVFQENAQTGENTRKSFSFIESIEVILILHPPTAPTPAAESCVDLKHVLSNRYCGSSLRHMNNTDIYKNILTNVQL